MAFTFSKSVASAASSSGTTKAETVVGVVAGSLVVCWAKWENNNTVTMTAFAETTNGSKSADGFSTAIVNTTPPVQGRYAYIFSGTGGDITYTATFSASAAFIRLIILTFTYTAGSVAADGTDAGSTGNSTAPNSGNMTTTGTDGLSCGAAAITNAVVLSSPLINGLAGSNLTNSGTSVDMWDKTYSTGFTGAASATYASSDNWVCSIISFKGAGAAAAATVTIGNVSLGLAETRMLTTGSQSRSSRLSPRRLAGKSVTSWRTRRATVHS